MPKTKADQKRQAKEAHKKQVVRARAVKRGAEVARQLSDLQSRLEGAEDALRESKAEAEAMIGNDNSPQFPDVAPEESAKPVVLDQDPKNGELLGDTLPTVPYLVYGGLPAVATLPSMITHAVCMWVGSSFSAVCSLVSAVLGTDELMGRAGELISKCILSIDPPEYRPLRESDIDSIYSEASMHPVSTAAPRAWRYLAALWVARASAVMLKRKHIATHVVIPRGDHLLAAQKRDRRAPHSSLSRMSEDAVTIEVVDVVTVGGTQHTLASDVAVRRQLTAASEKLEERDAGLVQVQAARLLYSNIPAKWSDCCISDTSERALIEISQRRSRRLALQPEEPGGLGFTFSVPEGITPSLLVTVGAIQLYCLFATGFGIGFYNESVKLKSALWPGRLIAATAAGLAGFYEEMVIGQLSARGRAAFALGEWWLKGFPDKGARAVCMHNAVHGHPWAAFMHGGFNFLQVWRGLPASAGFCAPLTLLMQLVRWLRGEPVFKVFGFGYRKKEVVLPLRNPFSRDAKLVKLPNYHAIKERRPAQVSVGPVVGGVAPPMPDVDDPSTVLDGAKHRFACECVVPDRLEVIRFNSFVRDWVRRNLDPIQPGGMLSFEQWLETTNYSLGRKLELTRAWDACDRKVDVTEESEDMKCNCFGKRETYESYKHARSISSRNDTYKCAVGPAAKTMENLVYDVGSYFIKHVPVKDRPAFIIEKFGHLGGPYIVTDYTSYEKSFHQWIMLACEVELYDWMLAWYPRERELLRRITGTNKCSFKWFQITLQGRRMSGEMTTSLGNGFTNLMLCLYAARECGVKIEVIVEGDDGLIYADGPFDTSPIERLGFVLKKEVHDSILSTSFCGLNLSQDLCSMTEPRKALLNLGWSHSQMMWGSDVTRLGLLRAKALSMLYEHPRCPILSVMARRCLQLTEGVRPRFDSNWYECQMQKEAVMYTGWAFEEFNRGITHLARADFERLYGISAQAQIDLENYLSTCSIGTLEHPVLTLMYADWRDAKHYAAHYVRRAACL